MSSDIVLTAALRNNLLSLQNTQRLIDRTQIRLATGLKVNSALDSPQSFFASQALNNRAGDLNRLLDGISQSVRTIEQANTGVSALTTLLNQADSIIEQAREELSTAGEQTASVVGNVDLSAVDDLDADVAGIDDNDQITFTLTDENGSSITLSDADGAGAGIVQIDTLDSIEQLITTINDFTNTADSTQALRASLTEDGFLKIESLQGGNLRVNFSTGGIDLASGLGFDYLKPSERSAVLAGASANRFAISASRTTALTSKVLYETESGSQVIADRTTLLTSLVNSSGTALDFTGDAGDDIILSIDGGGTYVDLGNITTLTVQGFVDAINDSTSLNTAIRANYDATTGQIEIEQIDPTISSIHLGARDTANTANDAAIDFGFGVEDVDVANNNALNVETENLVFGASSSTLAGLEQDYNSLLSQIDDIVADSSYRGVSLLNGDDLETVFNEDRTSSLLTQGVDFTTAGLNISAANFRNETVVDSADDEVFAAIESVRAFGNTIANDLAVIQVRRDFTEQTINTLQAGADDLTVADQNEEGANLLALQTRQALGITSLSLASQSQQAVLRLF